MKIQVRNGNERIHYTTFGKVKMIVRPAIRSSGRAVNTFIYYFTMIAHPLWLSAMFLFGLCNQDYRKEKIRYNIGSQ